MRTLTCWLPLLLWSLTATALELKSPNDRLSLSFEVKDMAGTKDCAVYSMTYQGQRLVADSRLGLRLQEENLALDHDWQILSSALTHHDETWKTVASERGEIRDCYRQLVVELQDHQTPPHRLKLTFRAYDEGVAFSYTVPEQPSLKGLTITSEATEFRFLADHPCWAVYAAQGTYTNKPLSQIGANCERPLVLQVKDGPTLAVGEARLVNYSRMRLKTAPGQALTLVPDLGGPVSASAPFTTPWRFLMVADSPAQLLEHNAFVLNLNDPCALSDTAWIRPGKVIRETSLSTAGGLACVDFAVKAGLQYIEFDAGWYGPEGSDASDARFVNVNTNRPQGGLDLQAVLRHANEHGVGVLLYVNRRALERQLDELLPLYQQWGVKGIKFGFVNVGPQKWTAWLHEAVRKCAQYHMVVDIHDEYRPTGWSRTYPNLLTQEGVRGNEEMPSADHNLILPFTRYLCGAADFTFCWNDTRLKTSHAHQLAASVVFFSPLQFLYWYDKPAQIQWAPELEFWKELPAAWDETRIVQGVIGQTVTVARRKGADWFIGTLNALQRRQIEVPLSFLPPNRSYQALIYSDAQADGTAPKQVSVREETVNSRSSLRADLAANGGQAIRLAPAKSN